MGYTLAGFATWVSDQELVSIRRRTKAGLEKAKADGKKLGAPRRLSDEQEAAVIEMVTSGVSQRCIAGSFGVSPATIRRAVKHEWRLRIVHSPWHCARFGSALLRRPLWTVDVVHCGAGGVPGEEPGVDPDEVGHITQAVSVLGLDVVPVPGIQDGPGVRLRGRGVAHVGDVNDGNLLALVGRAHQDMVAGR